MRLKHGWSIVLVVVVLAVAACGPLTADPTPGGEAVASQAPPLEQAQETATQEKAPTEEAVTAASIASVGTDDWHVLGSPDAPVTIVEYSDFQ
jgi:protein-disulfide isomerase